MPIELTRDPEAFVRAKIEAFVRESALNRLVELDGSPIYEEPLVGFADGDDPLFAAYKEIIGPFHLTPREALAQAQTEQPNAAHGSVQHVSVICYVLPISEATRASNRAEKKAPSARWAHTRHYGEEFNDAVRDYMVEMLRERGYLAIAPVRSGLFKIHNEGVKLAPASTWSERHVQYVAGMGTFSLNDGFITPKGMAMRCGSVVTNLPLQATPRTYPNHYANCLYLAQGVCGECIARCPAGAISEQGHDKKKCQAYSYGALNPYRDQYGVSVTGCGLCQTGVPCEACIPVR